MIDLLVVGILGFIAGIVAGRRRTISFGKPASVTAPQPTLAPSAPRYVVLGPQATTLYAGANWKQARDLYFRQTGVSLYVNGDFRGSR